MKTTTATIELSDDAIQFYASNKTPVDKMVSIGSTRMNLSPAAIRSAAADLYSMIQSGHEIRPIRIAWEVYARAKHIKSQAEAAEDNRVKSLQSEIKRLRRYINQPWYKRIIPYKPTTKEGN